jgi:hypothetical protein
VVRCRPGIVTNTAFGTIPDQRCTASLRYARHRIRETATYNPDFESIRKYPFHRRAIFVRFACGMSAGKAGSGETMQWYVEPNHFGGRRTAAVSRRRHDDDRANSLAVAVTVALLFVLIAGAFMFGGRAALAPLVGRERAAREANRTGAIVYPMADGVLCRRMAFDNTTAEITGVAVERCPGAIGLADGPSPGKFRWTPR